MILSLLRMNKAKTVEGHVFCHTGSSATTLIYIYLNLSSVCDSQMVPRSVFMGAALVFLLIQTCFIHAASIGAESS